MEDPVQKRGGHVRREKDIAEHGLTSATILISKPFGHDLRVSAQDPPFKLDLILRFSPNFISIIQRSAELQNLYVWILLTNADLMILVRIFSTHPTNIPIEKFDVQW